MHTFSRCFTLLWHLGVVNAWEELGQYCLESFQHTSNTHGNYLHDAGEIWVEKQQLSNHNWNYVGLEGKKNYPDKIISNILKYVLPWIWFCWCKQISYKWDSKCCSPWGNIDLPWDNLANAHKHTKYPGHTSAASIPSYDFKSATNIS